MNKNIVIMVLLIALSGSWAYFFGLNQGKKDNSLPQNPPIMARQELSQTPQNKAVSNENSDIQQLFKQQKSDVFVTGKGVVKKVLADDNQGSRHQRFILELPNGQTLLVAHNIDLAERLPNLQAGDEVSFAGDYVYNNKGGTLHWTHKDPRGNHKNGYLMYQGKIYQ